MSIAELVDGPLWYASVTIFVVGVLAHFAGLLRLGGRTDYSKPRASAAAGAIRANISRMAPRRVAWPRMRLQVVAGYLFHVGLFALLFFAAPHVEFYQEKIFGFGWITMPHWAFILTSEAAFLGLMLLWLHRIIDPVTRRISRRGDHFSSILIFLVMLTGCFALSREYESLRLIHFFLAEVLLAWFPFSPLMHTFTFAWSRGSSGAQYGRRGVPV
jgi:nitrate reductase gamma subunit